MRQIETPPNYILNEAVAAFCQVERAERAVDRNKERLGKILHRLPKELLPEYVRQTEEFRQKFDG